MESANAPRVWLWTAIPAGPDEAGTCLEGAGIAVRRLAPGDAMPDEASTCLLAVVDGGGDDAAARRLGSMLRGRTAECAFPFLYLAATTEGRRAALAAGADVCLLRPYEPEDLVDQVKALVRVGEAQLRLMAQATEARHVNRRLQQAHQRIDQELELARRIQQSFLPHTLPEVPHARLAVHYRPCGRVGGDFYDVFRLDENHLGFYIADAMGHGLPGSLLTIFLKKGVRPKEISGKDYRLVPPDEVLRRLNREMIEQRLLENTFITMMYALLNFQDGTLRFARAGHPLPIYLPAGGEPKQWSTPGPILGVFESEFPTQTHTLREGDKVLLFTDGVDAVRVGGQAPGVGSLSACAAKHRDLPVRNFVEALAGDLLRQQEPADDVTLLALEWV